MILERQFDDYYQSTYFQVEHDDGLVFFPGATWACLFWKSGYAVPEGDRAALTRMLRRHDYQRMGYLGAIAAFAVGAASLGMRSSLTWALVIAAALAYEFVAYRKTRNAVAGYRLTTHSRNARALFASVARKQGTLPAWRNNVVMLVAIALTLLALGGVAVAWKDPKKWPAALVSVAFSGSIAAAMILVRRGQSLRQRNEELQRLVAERTAELERVNRHKSDFLANMSHELRTPLNAIIGFSDVMLSGMAGTLPDKQKEFIGDIRDSGKHLLALINDILDLSKVEAGRMELDIARFDVQAAVANAMTQVRGRADRHAIRLAAEFSGEIGTYDGDERKFKQIVLNLLTNAVKFTPEGGSVTIDVRHASGAYVFSVTDTGVGIAPEDHGTIFEEFRQVGTDYARKAEGTGLGLALTKRLVELHGGTIRLKSAVGEGSTFTFELPIAKP